MAPKFRILGLASAAALLLAVSSPALAQTSPSPPAQCTNNTTTNTPAASGTSGGNTGTNTSVNSTTPNTSASPVQPNTPANTNANPMSSNNPGAHATPQNGNVCGSNNGTNGATPGSSQPTAPATMPQSNVNSPANQPRMNALTDNPNGSNWLAKFDRPRVIQENLMGRVGGRHHAVHYRKPHIRRIP
jgi:hypothetical protein